MPRKLHVGENEIQTHQCDFDRIGLAPASNAVVFLPDGRERRLGSHMIDLRPISCFVNADVSLEHFHRVGIREKHTGREEVAAMKSRIIGVVLAPC